MSNNPPRRTALSVRLRPAFEKSRSKTPEETHEAVGTQRPAGRTRPGGARALLRVAPLGRGDGQGTAVRGPRRAGHSGRAGGLWARARGLARGVLASSADR